MVKYYSPIKQNEIFICTVTLTVLKIIMLSKIRQTQKDQYNVISVNIKNIGHQNAEC